VPSPLSPAFFELSSAEKQCRNGCSTLDPSSANDFSMHSFWRFVRDPDQLEETLFLSNSSAAHSAIWPVL
jgi:hypothetical protein